MKALLTAALLGATAIAAPASAAVIDFSFGAYGSSFLGRSIVGTGSFTTSGDEGTFTLADGLSDFSSTGSSNIFLVGGDYSLAKTDLAAFTATISGGALTALSFVTTQFATQNLVLGLFDVGLPTTNNRITVSGLGAGNVSALRGRSALSGDLTIDSITPSVPEPSIWAMMLVGFGSLGAMMRRRKATVSSVRFA